MANRTITLDFETYYDKEYSLSKITTEAYIRDNRFQVIGFSYKVDEEDPVWVTGSDDDITLQLSALDIENSYLIAHNMAFDGAILAWRYGIKPKYYLDTLSMARPITGQTVGGSLSALAKKFMLGEKGTEVVKAIGMQREDFTAEELAAYGEYCKNDVVITYNLYQILKQHNPPKELYIQDMMLRMFTDPVLKLDSNVLGAHLTNVQDKKEELMKRISVGIGRENLMSNPKFAQVLKQLKVEPPTKISARTGKETFAFGKTDQAFKNLLLHDNPMVQAVVAARFGIKSTLEETRTESFLGIAKRGRLPILLNYWGAHTGRASGGDKMNLHNLPRAGALRRSITAPTGHVLVACDSAQIEARVVAWLAEQNDLLEQFKNNEDIYSNFASEVYGRTITKADKVERFVGKTCILGLGYGMGADKFKATLKVGAGGISVDVLEEEAKHTVTLYRNKYNRIAQLWVTANYILDGVCKGYRFDNNLRGIVSDREGLRLFNNTMIRYPELHKTTDGYEYSGRYGPVKIYGGKVIENAVQGLARIIVFDQMAKIDQLMRKRDTQDRRYKVVLTVHDEVVCAVPEDEEDWCKEIMVDIMSTPPRWCADIPLSCEVEAGNNYADTK